MRLAAICGASISADRDQEVRHHLLQPGRIGVHFCLGASLARMELRIGLEELLRRALDHAVLTDRVVRLRSDTNRGFARLAISIP